MDDTWQMIYSTPYLHLAEIARAILADHGITGFIINKKDSAYLFGEVELYVQAEDVLIAKQLLTKEQL